MDAIARKRFANWPEIKAAIAVCNMLAAPTPGDPS
jgi:hypothetical protein